jgi:hypothetical protein
MPTINKVHIYEERTRAIDQIILVLFLWGSFLHILKEKLEALFFLHQSIRQETTYSTEFT